MINWKKVWRVPVVLGALAVTVGYTRGYGIREVEEIKTQYLGKPAALVHEDIRWSPDRYYMLMNKGTDEEIILNLSPRDYGRLIAFTDLNQQNR